MRLGAPLVLLVGYATANNISDGVAGKIQLAGYLTNFLPISKMRLTNFSNGFHVQHLLCPSSLWVIPKSKKDELRWVNFERRLSPQVGHYCMPIHRPRNPSATPLTRVNTWAGVCSR